MKTLFWLLLIVALLYNAGNKVNDAYAQGWSDASDKVRVSCRREWTSTCAFLLGGRRS